MSYLTLRRQHNFETNKGLIFDYAHLIKHYLMFVENMFDLVNAVSHRIKEICIRTKTKLLPL